MLFKDVWQRGFMKDFVICMDVSGDIDPSFAEREEVRFLPMDFTIGSIFQTSKGMEPESLLKVFYDGQRKKDLTKTTQITPFQYESFFEKIIKEENKDIICFCLSSGLSSTYQSALLAISQLQSKYPERKVFAVDSLAATGGIGLEVKKACQLRREGMSIDDVFEKIKILTHQIYHFFMVDDMGYLKRGGRVSASTAFFASLLNFKPILEIDAEGHLQTIDKKRGSKLGIMNILDRYSKVIDEKALDEVSIIHGDNLTGAEFLKAEMEKRYPSVKSTTQMLSPIIGAHTGPGMVAIIGFGVKREEKNTDIH